VKYDVVLGSVGGTGKSIEDRAEPRLSELREMGVWSHQNR